MSIFRQCNVNTYTFSHWQWLKSVAQSRSNKCQGRKCFSFVRYKRWREKNKVVCCGRVFWLFWWFQMNGFEFVSNTFREFLHSRVGCRFTMEHWGWEGLYICTRKLLLSWALCRQVSKFWTWCKNCPFWLNEMCCCILNHAVSPKYIANIVIDITYKSYKLLIKIRFEDGAGSVIDINMHHSHLALNH